MPLWTALFDVLLLLLAALLFGVLFERLRQSAIMGYLLAGLLLGPNAYNIISNGEQVEALAELGVALLLFSIGLEFSWSRLRSLGMTVLAGGVLQVVITLGAAFLIALPFGVGTGPALAIGGMVALSSTACVLRLLVDRAEMDSVHGRLALGILLIQDLAVVPLVLLVSILGRGDMGPAKIALELVTAAGLAVLLVVVFYLLFKYAVPMLLSQAVMRRNRELPILLAIVTGLGAAGIAHSVHLSPALGAFVAGMILAESPYSTQFRADITALRTLLMTIFFSAVGMLANPLWMLTHLHLLLPVVIAMIAGKAAIIWAILTIFGRPSRAALTTGIVLAQVGEFSFVLASTAYDSSLVGERTFLLMISSTIVTLFMTPYLIALAPVVSRVIHRSAHASQDDSSRHSGLTNHIVIVGYGPAGQAVADALREDAREIVIIDLNQKTVATAKEAGFHAYFGDAGNPAVLEHLHVDQAYAIIITVPDPSAARAVIQQSRIMSSTIFIMARARYHVYRWELEYAGAHVVVDEEQHVGETLGVELMRHILQLDVTPDGS